ncbi:MAG: type II toxin-antitoxin system RelE/ParE family toxin [Pseudomonadota bacterium]|uniref:type II toxin-antitoxin system RelE/ParE family toxin n=1 Tax=Sphingobium sp. TaxID=1912891 RepID=UPI002E1B24B7
MSDTRYDVILTGPANDDLRSIHAYLAEVRTIEDADDLLDRLTERVRSLQNFPLRGSVPQELTASGMKDVRQLVYPPYRLIYSLVDNVVLILLIADGRRDMRTLMEQRLLNR